jgi:hypothetical protein
MHFRLTLAINLFTFALHLSIVSGSEGNKSLTYEAYLKFHLTVRMIRRSTVNLSPHPHVWERTWLLITIKTKLVTQAWAA